jgi:hypothetical protein
MGIIFNFNNYDSFAPGTMISFGRLDYIANQLGNLHLQDPNPVMQEEQLHPLCKVLAGLENTVDVGAPALARHMDLHAWNVFVEFCLEHIVNWATARYPCQFPSRSKERSGVAAHACHSICISKFNWL